MKNNRRNYYRILHVQPEAPAEIIKASYRTLMSKLKMHPDLGGDHDMAILVNEAYAVLGDPERRAAYDLEIGRLPYRGRRADRAEAATGHAGPWQAAGAAARGSQGSSDGTAWTMADEDGEHCPWCALAVPVTIKPATRCARCRAPLAKPPAPDAQAQEILGRRGASRRPRANLAIMQRQDGGATLSVRLRDLSLSGLGLVTTTAVADDTRVWIQAQDFEAIATIVGSQREYGDHILHARLLSLALTRRTGVFVSETA
ncbi:MAG: DnaJ domain-containing protein [Burkholderiaceae bacterium]